MPLAWKTVGAQSRLEDEVEGRSPEDLPPDLGLSDLLPDLLLDSDLSPDPDFSLDEELAGAFSDDDPFDPLESLDSPELELLLRESVT